MIRNGDIFHFPSTLILISLKQMQACPEIHVVPVHKKMLILNLRFAAFSDIIKY